MIADNDIFWNNFNFHQGHPPFKVRKDGDRGARPGRHRHPAARRPRQPGREQPRLRQLPGRRRPAIDGHPAPEEPEAIELDGNKVEGNEFGSAAPT